MKIKFTSRTLGITLLLLGMLVATIVNIALTSPRLESSYHFRSQQIINHRPLTSLKCPRAVGVSQPAILSVTLDNKADKPLKTVIMAHIARPIYDFEERVNVDIPAGEKKTFTWQTTPEDVIFGRMILADFFVIHALDQPNRYSTCTVLVLPWNVNGDLFLGIFVALGLLLVILGGWLWIRKVEVNQTNRPFVIQGTMLLAEITVVGMLAAFFGVLALGVLAILLTALFGIVLAAYILQGI